MKVNGRKEETTISFDTELVAFAAERGLYYDTLTDVVRAYTYE